MATVPRTKRTAASRSASRPASRARLLAMMLIGGGLLIFGVLGALLLLDRDPPPAAQGAPLPSAIPAAVEYPAPDLRLTDLQGAPVDLAGYRDRIVLVNNWATWCPPCKAEMPTLQAYFEDHQAQQFTIIAIESGDTVQNVSAFVEEYGLTFPVWPDSTMQALAAFRNDSLPSSYVIDRTGTVRLAWTGAISREMLEKYVTPILEE